MTIKEPALPTKWEDSHFLVRSIILGLILVVPGMALLWLASNNKDPTWGTFYSNLSTTLISVGMLAILYEAFLKRALIRDIQRGSQVDTQLLNAGITNATVDPDSLRMREIFGSATTLDIVPLNPLTWHEKNFSWLTQLAVDRAIKCRVFLPEPTAYSQLLAASFEGDPELMTAAHCSAKFKQYSSSWESAELKGSKSTLEVLFYRGYPQSSFVLADGAAVVHVGDPKGNDLAVGNITYAYRGSAAKATLDWLQGAIRRLDAVAITGTEPDTRTPEDILPLASGDAPGPHSDRSNNTKGEIK